MRPRGGKEKKDILIGFHSVHEALKAGKREFHRILISKTRTHTRAEKISKLAARGNIRVEITNPELMDKVSQGANHQGIIGESTFLHVKKAAQLVSLVKKSNEPCFILVMESIEDPHNMGALIRTALCTGVDYILVPKDRSAALSSAVSRSSAGAMEHADIYMATNIASVLRGLKEAGVWVSGLDGAGDKVLPESDLTGKIALVIGGEHKGLRPVIKKECDFLLSIPNKGRINSLNASVAGGMAMYEAMRQRT